MNLLSSLAMIVFSYFCFYMIEIGNNAVGQFRVLTMGALFGMAEWSFCYAFFYSAPSEQLAFLWIRLSALGFCGAIYFTLYWAILFTGHYHWQKNMISKLLLFLPFIILVAANLTGSACSLAVNLVQSTSGMGWALYNTVYNWKFWAIIIYLAVYMGCSGILFIKYSQTHPSKPSGKLSKSIFIIDAATLPLIFMTDLVQPFFVHWVPPLSGIIIVLIVHAYKKVGLPFDDTNIMSSVPYEQIINTSLDPMLVLNVDGIILFANSAFYRLMETNKIDLLRIPADTFFDTKTIISWVGDSKHDVNNTLSGKTVLYAPQGKEYNVLLNASRIIQDNVLRGFILYLNNITELIELQEHLADLAYHDKLTELPNRLSFFEDSKRYVNNYVNTNQDFGAIMLDLNRFKEVNDKLGHAEGDKLLIRTANELMRVCKDKGTVYRMGGDEFLILLDTKQPGSLEAFVTIVKNALKFEIKKDLCVSAAAGAVVYSEFENLDEALRAADDRMYFDKHICKSKTIREEKANDTHIRTVR